MQLFSVGKVPVYCDGIAHRVETRRGDSVKVVDLTLKIEPFTPQLASALDQDEYGFVKRMLFKVTDGTPLGDLRSVEFIPPGDRQRVTCFASPDTEMPSIALDQCKVTKIRARSQKDASGWVLYLHLSFGPLSRTELEYVNAFYTEQRFMTFDAAEPSLDFEEADDDVTDADEKARQQARPAPIWDDDEQPSPVAASEDSPATVDAKRAVGTRHKLHSHQDKKKNDRKKRIAAAV